MTRKDYIEIARILREFRNCFNSDGNYSSMVEWFADWCEDDNPRFDRDRFEKACKVA